MKPPVLDDLHLHVLDYLSVGSEPLDLTGQAIEIS